MLLLAFAASLIGCGGGAPPLAPAKPTIALSPTSLTFTATAGGANPASQTVTVSNTGTATLNFAASATSTPAGWLAVSPASRTVAAGGSTMLTVSANIAGLAGGNFTGSVNVSDSQASNSPQSVSVSLTVNNPVPTLTSISPTSATAGGATFTLIVTGTNFISASVVRWNNLDRITAFRSGTQLEASILASDIATAGTAQVTVFNPAPGGGTSNALTFTITIPGNPVPAISSLLPTSAAPGGAAFTLTVIGANFVSGSIVRWNGLDRTPTFVSASRLTASIAATDIAAPGTAIVTVFNSGPGGGTSNTVFFPVSLATSSVAFAPKSDFATGALPSLMAVGDFNADGKLDLAVANFSPGTVSILLGL